MNTCAQCSVRETAICRSLAPHECDALNCLGQHRLIARGDTVIREGDPSVLVGNIIEGVLKLSASTADGREQALGIMFPADFIGRPFGPVSSHSVTALTDARICTFSRTAFDAFVRDRPELEHALLAYTLTQLDSARQWMVSLTRRSARQRVAVLLLAMAMRLSRPAETAPDGGNAGFELPFGRQDMAGLLGLTIETVSRQITWLREAGIVATPARRAVVVLDRAALEACAQAD